MMTARDVVETLERHGIQPSAQRLAVAQYVLTADDHPSAEQVWTRVKDSGFPQISRATTYNTLNLFVEKGLLRELVLAPGRVVFDPNLDQHHHFIDDETGEIHDIPWDAVKCERPTNLKGYVVREWSMVLRGRKKRT